MNRFFRRMLAGWLSIAPWLVPAQNFETGDYGWLYCHMSDRGEWTAYALSRDGLHFHDLIGGDPVFDPALHARIEGGTRDAYVCRKHDGSGYLMVTTDMCVAKSGQWYNYGIDLLTSDDLIRWESVTFDFREGPACFSDPDAPDPCDYAGIARVWAPQIFWNPDYVWPDGRRGGYMIYYSLLNPAEESYDRMYYSYADESFTTLTKPRLLFDWGYATIDADIHYLESDGLYHLLIKKEGGRPGIFTATAPALHGPWGEPVEEDYVDFEGNKKCEGVSAFRLAGDSTWCVGYIEYSSRPKRYRICRADEHLRNFRDPRDIEGVEAPQHGSFLRLTQEEYERLQAWSDAHEAEHLAPDVHNPVIAGYFADPEILYAEQTGRYYLYPTTDGAVGWNNHDFRVYSSDDLRTWRDEGVLLDLRTDCTWADSRGWAPCIIERKYADGYKYFYYFVAEGQIGVAVAEHPTGPFRDALGRPMLDKNSTVAQGGQVIDPDVFRDPQTGRYYLYWGNGFLAVAELNDDMVSLKEETVQVIIPREKRREMHYNEGTYLFWRDGKYYFTWSENDTRSPDYRVRWAMSDSPTALTNGVAESVLLQKDGSKAIWGTGHHAVIRRPDTNEWYIVYHRFARPDAIKLGWEAGYYREICIDKLEFNDDGTLKPVVPTL